MLQSLLTPLLQPLLRPPLEVSGGSGLALYLDFLTEYIDPRITYSGGANGTRTNSAGSIVAAVCPRFDYDPVMLAAKWLLVEEARTNLLTYSQDVTNASWGKFGLTPTLVADSEFTWQVNRLTATATSFARAAQSHPLTVQSYSFSVAVKAGSSGFLSGTVEAAGQVLRMYANLSTGATSQTVESGTISATSSRTRVSASYWCYTWVIAIPSAAAYSAYFAVANAYQSFSATIGQYLDVAFVQLEAGSFPTSYIPTTSASVTRSADSAVMTGTNFSAIWNAIEDTVVCQFRTGPVTGTRPIASFDDGTANQQILLYTSGTNLKMTVINGGVTQADLTLGTVAAYTVYKAAFALKASDFAAVMTGGTMQTSASGTMPVVTLLRTGTDFAGNSQNGHSQRIQTYRRRNANSFLQAAVA